MKTLSVKTNNTYFSGAETFQLVPILRGFSNQRAACLLMNSDVTLSGFWKHLLTTPTEKYM